MTREISIPEQRVCEHLSPLLRDHAVGESLSNAAPLGSDILNSLDFFLPEVLREVHREWVQESLDGVYPQKFTKIGDREVELFGLALFISDQTFTPLHFRLQLSHAFACVSWIDLRLGERTPEGCLRVPYGARSHTILHDLSNPDAIEWYYHVGYGERNLA